MDDKRHYARAEYWNIPTDGLGDCEDYALTKRQALMAAGFAEPALRIALVMTARGERHAVLTIATDRGDYVLDNLTGAILNWDKTDYEWLARQDPNQAWGWVALDGAAGAPSSPCADGATHSSWRLLRRLGMRERYLTTAKNINASPATRRMPVPRPMGPPMKPVTITAQPTTPSRR